MKYILTAIGIVSFAISFYLHGSNEYKRGYREGATYTADYSANSVIEANARYDSMLKVRDTVRIIMNMPVFIHDTIYRNRQINNARDVYIDQR